MHLLSSPPEIFHLEAQQVRDLTSLVFSNTKGDMPTLRSWGKPLIGLRLAWLERIKTLNN